ncbi:MULTISPECIES: tRNA (adenosine(37)-N6)-threonylcarbamoyltransferase complex dimerization subunit type 1 TsaB [Methylotenera]|uniref:tRNA (adenosine(37)-N6)-threonylcarbamoyltransferase complex dimerization subunit type 1 TsaB n=1 Tax=Methylotenera TaxID=359407 RepID=UPI000370411B|nr:MULTISPECIES: tRNA (adenosine(37)-N6)-threonylcarbamoyltransferase complex dimerization subunit type 1 TsaB [Methylotenera]
MNLLALDTSTEFLSLALMLGERTFTHYQAAGSGSSQLVLPQIQILLDSANVELKDLDGIAFGAGPGAFTGVRIASGVAQGLGFGANLPVVGINTLIAVAEASKQDKVIVCLDARMGEIYHAALVKENGNWLEVSETKVCKPQDAPALEGEYWFGAGSGWAAYAEALTQLYTNNLSQKLPNVLQSITPTAEAILHLAQPVFAAGQAKPAMEAMPIYIRNRVALTTLEREQGLRL